MRLARTLLILGMITSGLLWAGETREEPDMDLFRWMTRQTPVEGPVSIIGLRIADLDGTIHRLGMEEGLNPVALVLIDTTCPISNRYVPTMNGLARKFADKGIAFYGFLSDPVVTVKEALAFRKAYDIKFPILFDSTGELARRLTPRVTPEAFLVGIDDRIAYRGRLDNRFAGVGKRARQNVEPDLENAMEAVAAGKAVPVVETQPIGCIYTPWEEPETVTWSRHIAPILNANCVECHQSGGIAPFALDSFELAKRRASMMSYSVEEGIMPPWRADVSFSKFRDERSLSKTQIKMLADWAKNPVRGNPEELLPPPPKPVSGWRLGEPDMVLTMPEPFEVPADGDDIYRYFVLPFELLERVDLVAIDFQPGDASVVHHSNFFIDYYGKGRQLDEADPEPGFATDETGGFMNYDGAGAIGGWAPGADPYKLPPGLGGELVPGGDIVIEVHYHPTGKAATDQSSLALYFSKGEPLKQVVGLFMGTQDVNISAGDDAYRRHFWMNVPAPMSLIDVTPHMHYLGENVTVEATLPDGSKAPLIRINDWDLRWQNIYVLREPVHLPAGSRIDAWYTFDNSDENPNNPNYPAKRVPWGWGSDEEMCELYLTIVPKNPGDAQKLIRASRASWMRSADPK